MRLDGKSLGQIRSWVHARVSTRRFGHIMGVENTAVALGMRYDLRENAIRAAALFHDCAKEMTRPQMRALFRKGPFSLDRDEKKIPSLWHPVAGANLAYHSWGCRDKGILDAIRCHTVGSPSMGPLAQALFIADFIEPGRNFKGVDMARTAAHAGLVEGVREKTIQTLFYLLSAGRKIHPRLLDTLNVFMDKR